MLSVIRNTTCYLPGKRIGLHTLRAILNVPTFSFISGPGHNRRLYGEFKVLPPSYLKEQKAPFKNSFLTTATGLLSKALHSFSCHMECVVVLITCDIVRVLMVVCDSAHCKTNCP